jgi:hypothetical protein
MKQQIETQNTNKKACNHINIFNVLQIYLRQFFLEMESEITEKVNNIAN